MREGFAYVRSRPDLMVIMGLVFVLGTFGMNFQLTMALMATQVFHQGATQYGLLGSIMAIGSLAAALLSARRREPRLAVVLVALGGFTVASLLAALAPTYDLFALALVPVGLASLTALTTANSTVQLSVEPQMRGRVMSLYMAILMGGAPIGAPLIGWLGDHAGPRWTIGIGTVMVGLSLLAVLALHARGGPAGRLRVTRTPRRLPRLALVPVTVPEPEPVR